MSGTCNNIIYITYHSNDYNKNIETYKQICKELKGPFYNDYDLKVYKTFEIYHSTIDFCSNWVTPVDTLQNLCKSYDIDIIGVSYEFQESAYVNSFEFVSDSIQETSGNHMIVFEAEDKENTETPPIDGDENILDSDINELDLSDDAILDKETIIVNFYKELE